MDAVLSFVSGIFATRKFAVEKFAARIFDATWYKLADFTHTMVYRVKSSRGGAKR